MTYTVYRLQWSEYHRYRSHLLTLDPESRYLRFGFGISDEGIDILFDRWTKNKDLHKIFVIENDDLDIVAAAHISTEDSLTEFAFSVLADYQGQGMGDALMKRCIEYCQNKLIKRGFIVCMATNHKIKKLAAKNNITIKTEEGESRGEFEIPDPSAVSYWSEYLNSAMSKLDHINKTQRKFYQKLKFPLHF